MVVPNGTPVLIYNSDFKDHLQPVIADSKAYGEFSQTWEHDHCL